VSNVGADAAAIMDGLRADVPARRFGTVDEIAALIVFLCSPAAR
jgi:NAD(P)-dependent dehydrogenase (short-subunit alcohol dehydrogenase family)